MPEKNIHMGCNACSRRRSGIPMGYVMICAPTCLSSWAESRRCWSLMRTSFPKRGKHSAGVGLQYCGTTGQVENCQVGVFLGLVSSRGHALIDRELYLPLCWCEDQERRLTAGIPERVGFQTKPELARTMIER